MFSEFYSHFPAITTNEVIFLNGFHISPLFWMRMFWLNNRNEFLKLCAAVLKVCVGHGKCVVEA